MKVGKLYGKAAEKVSGYAGAAHRNGETSGPIDGEAIRRSREDLLVQIRFFQHERLVHLIVTVTFAILTVLSLLGCVFSPQPSLFALVILLLVLLVPYIRHYYILENGVQMLYVYYDNLGKSWRIRIISLQIIICGNSLHFRDFPINLTEKCSK